MDEMDDALYTHTAHLNVMYVFVGCQILKTCKHIQMYIYII
jgi:hypothetical protein